mgnify:CR=1 FL=1
MKNKEKELEELIRLKNTTEALFTTIQYIYLNDLKVDDLDVARLKNITTDLFNQKINNLKIKHYEKQSLQKN